MTQESPEQESIQNYGSSQMENASHGPSGSLRPPPEATSDNDVSEKPVREKLKKTSIASISQHATKIQDAGQETDDSGVTNTEVAQTEPSPAEATSKEEMDPSRGRPLKKRSFDGLEITDTYEDANVDNGTQNERSNGHIRKRSRDVRTGEILKEDRLPRGVDTTLEEEAEYYPGQAESSRPAGQAFKKTEAVSVQNYEIPLQMEVEQNPKNNGVGTAEDKSSLEISKAPPDHEMRDSAPSPRKKRSRDQFDTEADREQKQKIPATEGSRAQRKSDELERTESKRASSESLPFGEDTTPFEQEQTLAADSSSEAVKNASSASTSILSPPTTSIRTVCPTNPLSDTQSQPSAATFASSGFADFASSATSPFGTLGASSASATTPSPFAPSATFGTTKTEYTDDVEPKGTQPAINGGFGAFAKTSSSGFGATEPLPFGTTGAAKSGVFGGSVFGGGFGGGFSGGGKLTNFAAPTGDAKLGTANGAVKPIGSPHHEGDEDDVSDDEGEGLGGDDQDGADEVDARFQHKDVETGEIDEVTVFSSRASLYTFKDRAWKEGGKGGFKLNLKSSDGDQSSKSGRFIMRAHQTFRVLLNAPVLKGMTIGDRGKEPNGKSFQFAAIEDGKVVPHLLKLGEAESKTLYHEVKKLQQSMSED